MNVGRRGFMEVNLRVRWEEECFQRSNTERSMRKDSLKRQKFTSRL